MTETSTHLGEGDWSLCISVYVNSMQFVVESRLQVSVLIVPRFHVGILYLRLMYEWRRQTDKHAFRLAFSSAPVNVDGVFRSHALTM